MPAQDQSQHPHLHMEDGIESVGRRIEQFANKVEHLISGEGWVDEISDRAEGPGLEFECENTPPNPLRHWRWE